MSPIHHPTRTAVPLSLPALALGLAVCLSGCGARETVDEIEHVRTVPYRGEKLNASSAERFGMQPGAGHGGMDHGGPGGQPMAPKYRYKVPAGWSELPAKMLRDVNLQAGDAECYVSTLTRGGLANNLNRWRRQMGRPPYSNAELAGLPRRQVLGRDAVQVEVAGTFTDMDGSKQDDQKLLAVYVQFPAFAVSVKMIGPKSAVDAGKAGFDSFLDSLQLDMPDPMQGAGSHGAAGAGRSGFDRSKVRWDVPAGWQPGKGSSMRIVTLQVPPQGKDQEGCELWVIDLAGSAGGVVDNINRWRNEVQKPPLSAQDVDRLPRIEVLGQPSPMLEEEGRYAGMGGPQMEKAMLFGVICPLDDVTVFIKMVGGVEEMRAAKNDFLKFLRSLRIDS